MKRYYKVAGHVFGLEIKSDSTLWNRLTQYSPFFIHYIPVLQPRPVFTLKVVDKLPEYELSMLYDQPTEPGETKIKLLNAGKSHIMCEMSPTSDRPVAARMVVDRNFKKGLIKIESEDLFAVNNSLMLLYAFSTAPYGTLEMHASVIKQDGKGYLFLAKSGTGKSTQSQMWLSAVRGSELLNDDNPIVRIQNKTVTVYGSPWSGKTPCYKNDSCPVGAFVKIHRAPQNSIRELGVLEAYSNIYSSSSGFKFDTKMAEDLNRTFAAFVENTKSYELDCLPNEDAAITCAKGVGANLDVRSIVIPNEILLAEVTTLLKDGKEVELKTKGASMLPFIYGGSDSVRLVGYNNTHKPAIGQIALAQIRKGQYVLHRIEMIDGTLVTLRGDGNLRGREYCHIGNLCGEATKIVKRDGRLISCTTPCFKARTAVWKAMPVFGKRVVLAFLRRYAKYILKIQLY